MYYTVTSKARIEDLTRDECKAIDKDLGRVRLSNAALQSMIVLMSARVIMRDMIRALKPLTAKTGTGKMLPMYMGGISKEIDKMLDTVSIEQLRTIMVNSKDTGITISSNPVPCYVNVSMDTLHGLTSQAMEVCSMMCAKTAHESKDCPVRRALEQIPGVTLPKVGADGLCPYAGMSLEVESDA